MSTHYTAGGMPLAFTQEDFLVSNIILVLVCFNVFIKFILLILCAAVVCVNPRLLQCDIIIFHLQL